MTLDQIIAKCQQYKNAGWSGDTEVVGNPQGGDYPSDVSFAESYIKDAEWANEIDKDAKKVIVIKSQY